MCLKHIIQYYIIWDVCYSSILFGLVLILLSVVISYVVKQKLLSYFSQFSCRHVQMSASTYTQTATLQQSAATLLSRHTG